MDIINLKKKGEKISKLKALEMSVAKWEHIHTGTGADIGAGNCALCWKYLGPHQLDSRVPACVGCPVFEKTGKTSCENTPYIAFAKRDCHRHDRSLVEDCKECEKTAYAEWEFLYDLYLEVKYGDKKENQKTKEAQAT